MNRASIIKAAALTAIGVGGWYLSENSRRIQVERIRREVHRLRNVRRDELNALKSAALSGHVDPGALGPVPLDGAVLDTIRIERGSVILTLKGSRTAAWLSSRPLDDLTDVTCRSWRGRARPGVLYTETMGGGWYAAYACLGWS